MKVWYANLNKVIAQSLHLLPKEKKMDIVSLSKISSV